MSSDTLPPAAIADTLPPPAGDEAPQTLASNAPPHPVPAVLPAKTRWFLETLEASVFDASYGRYLFSDGSSLDPKAVDWRRYREVNGGELPSPRESLPAMLQPAHLAVLQLPLQTIEGLLKVVEFLRVPGRGVRFDSLPSGAIDVMLAAGLGHPEDELELGYHVSQALAVDVALGEAMGGAFVKLGVVR